MVGKCESILNLWHFLENKDCKEIFSDQLKNLEYLNRQFVKVLINKPHQLVIKLLVASLYVATLGFLNLN